jgi:hypothetical protein
MPKLKLAMISTLSTIATNIKMIAKGVLALTLISARASRIGCELFMKPRQLFYVRRVVHGGLVVWISFVASERLR